MYVGRNDLGVFHPKVNARREINAQVLDVPEDGRLEDLVYPEANQCRRNSEGFSGEGQGSATES